MASEPYPTQASRHASPFCFVLRPSTGVLKAGEPLSSEAAEAKNAKPSSVIFQTQNHNAAQPNN